MKNKIPIFIFLQALGLSEKKIIYSIKNIKTLENSTKTTINKSTEKALIKLNEITIEQESNIVKLKDIIILNRETEFQDYNKIILYKNNTLS